VALKTIFAHASGKYTHQNARYRSSLTGIGLFSNNRINIPVIDIGMDDIGQNRRDVLRIPFIVIERLPVGSKF